MPYEGWSLDALTQALGRLGREISSLSQQVANAQASLNANVPGAAQRVAQLQARLAAAEAEQVTVQAARVAAQRALAGAASQAAAPAAAPAAAETATLVTRAGHVLGRIGSVGGWFEGGAAVAAGAVVTAAVAIGTTIVVAQVAGSFSGDTPVRAGKPNRPTAAPDTRDPNQLTQAGDAYAVFVLTNISNGSIFVGQESSLKEAHTCDFAGGGPPGCTSMVTFTKASADFKTYDEAKADWCKTLAGAKQRPVAIAHDISADVYGGSYWIGTAPTCSPT
jgi:hypothetical protein